MSAYEPNQQTRRRITIASPVGLVTASPSMTRKISMVSSASSSTCSTVTETAEVQLEVVPPTPNDKTKESNSSRFHIPDIRSKEAAGMLLQVPGMVPKRRHSWIGG